MFSSVYKVKCISYTLMFINKKKYKDEVFNLLIAAYQPLGWSPHIQRLYGSLKISKKKKKSFHVVYSLNHLK